METQFSQLPINQKNTKVKINIELTSEINITHFVARQKANVYLLMHLGNLLWADEPKLVVNENNLRWRIPIIYTIPERLRRQVGELVMDVNTGEIILHESNPTTLKEIEEHAQHIFENYSHNTSL
ncbi:MAG: hypothetical protein SCK70_07690 [bacterium]|nr:hypothetical protein [bacterium]